MEFVSHSLVRAGTIEKRLYQETVLATAIGSNTLAVLPTGLGKTAIAVLLAAHRMNKYGGRVMILAPTKPLVEQHRKRFAEFLELPSEDMQVFTGKTPPAERKLMYSKASMIFATPQVVQNDLISGRLSLADYTLLVLDECHRGIGDYPYPYIAEMYTRAAENPRILGITASPGGTKEKIDAICKNLKIEAVEIRTEKDKDVKPYIKGTTTDWILVDLPQEFLEVQKLLKACLDDRYKELRATGFMTSQYGGKREMLMMQGRLRKIIASKTKPPTHVFSAISLSAEALKIEHALELLETQGSKSLLEYLRRLRAAAEEGKTKAAKRVMNDARIEAALLKAYELDGKGVEHPKLRELAKLMEVKLTESSKFIIFSQYRDTVQQIVNTLKEVEGCRPVAFIGQSSRGGPGPSVGISQRDQVRILEDFRRLKYNCLVCTSVGEEGLDIPAVDAVVFYEPVPSEIRAIQRRGRTGRQTSGEVIIMMARGTRDEGIYWSAHHKEKRMKNLLKNMRSYKYDDKKQTTLSAYSEP